MKNINTLAPLVGKAVCFNIKILWHMYLHQTGSEMSEKSWQVPKFRAKSSISVNDFLLCNRCSLLILIPKMHGVNIYFLESPSDTPYIQRISNVKHSTFRTGLVSFKFFDIWPTPHKYFPTKVNKVIRRENNNKLSNKLMAVFQSNVGWQHR